MFCSNNNGGGRQIAWAERICIGLLNSECLLSKNYSDSRFYNSLDKSHLSFETIENCF